MAEEKTTDPIRPPDERSSAALRPGDRLAGHLIRSEAGRGGAGIVYVAEHERLGVTRALKVLSQQAARDARFRARFERESRLAAGLEHPNVVPVYEAGESDGSLYISMRFVDGTDLALHLDRNGPLPTAEVAELTRQLGSALDAAHAQGLVHRDVKPANIFLERREAVTKAFLGDFGISRLIAGPGDLTETGQMLGTVSYVAPEQIAGLEVDGRADVYSLACVAYRALTGAAPFDRETKLATMFAHANAPRPKPSLVRKDLGAAVDRVFAEGLAIEPAARQLTAGEFANELQLALGEGDGSFRQAVSSHRRLIALVAAVLAIAALLAGFALAGAFDRAAKPSASPPDSPLPEGALSTVELDFQPGAVALGQLNAWVTSASSSSVTAIVPATDGQAGNPIAIEGEPSAVIVAFGSTWVVDQSEDTLDRLDPESAAAAIQIPVGSRPVDITATSDALWVANRGDGTVSRIDPVTNTVTATIRTGGSPSSITAGEGGVWVADPSTESLTLLDSSSGSKLASQIAVHSRPNSIAAGEGAVWIVDGEAGTLRRLAPGTQTVSEPIDAEGNATAVATGFGYVWVTLSAGAVARVDPSTLATFGPSIATGSEPDDIVAANGLVLTANSGDDSVTRIDPTALSGG